MRKICVVTGSRAEYGLLKPLLSEIVRNKELELCLIAAGMHLSDEFGRSEDEIKRDGFSIDHRVEMNPDDDTGMSMAESIGKGISSFARCFAESEPDICVVFGDRIEALSAAIASAYMNIPVAHVHGGDCSAAGLDESARHAITKLAHLHFAATPNSAKRIEMMGEEKWRIFHTGSPAIDSVRMETMALPGKDSIKKRIGIDLDEPFIIVLQHPVTTEPHLAGAQMKETLDAVERLPLNKLVIYPNSDAGSRAMISEIEKKRGSKKFIIKRNIDHPTYIALLSTASAMVGNSSGGIIESTYFKLPVVNIGTRQAGRERGGNIIDVEQYDANIIEQALKKAMSKEFRMACKKTRQIYGNGYASKRMCRILTKIDLGGILQKRLSYDT